MLHRRGHDFSKGVPHCVKVRVLVCLDIFKLKRHGIFDTVLFLGCFIKKGLQKGGGHGHFRTPLATPCVTISLFIRAQTGDLCLIIS